MHTAPFSRSQPSPRYRDNIAMYREMHVGGETAHGKSAEETFTGKMCPEHAPAIKELVDRKGARTLLDYGCGKGQQYEWRDLELPDGQRVESLQSFWGVEQLARYDPGYEPFSKLPDGRYDAVICTDVLEHIPEEDLPWILDEMFGYAQGFVYANVACYPAKKLLPNGDNAHITVRPPEWWAGLVHGVASRHPGVGYRILLATKDGPRKIAGLFGKRALRFHTIER